MGDRLYGDRARAESFGSVAAQYDRHRPAPPDALVDDLAALHPQMILDVGCGTGKAARALSGRGLAVLGVEPDQRMAQVARGHGVPVEEATFEDWDEAGRRFDLLTFADAWHWVDPAVGIPKAARLLRPGGRLARWWNDCVLDEPVIAAFEAVYRRHAPHIVQVWRPAADKERVHAGAAADPFTATAAFSPAVTSTYRWERIMTADEWVGTAETTSAHQRLGPQRLSALLRELHTTIERLGGTVRSHHETYLALVCRI